MKPRVYIDTSVIGGCFDEEFQEWSNKLFDEFINGQMIAVISNITTDELIKAGDNVKNKIKDIPSSNIELVEKNIEINDLAERYIRHKAISGKYSDDALHIATATYYKVDVLVSWNFKHIVNLRRIKIYNAVNLMNGYSTIEIRTPREVIL
jgi:predicted nucleic acid-binding protein